MSNINNDVLQMAQRAKKASRALSILSTEQRNRCLLAMADGIAAAEAEILTANKQDMEQGRSMGLTAAMLDRLELTPKRILAMATGLREAAQLPDPVGRTLSTYTRPDGLRLEKISCPIGVIAIIFESRPNVAADAAGLCLKSGNATILRGGKEALKSNCAIVKAMMDAARTQCDFFPEGAIEIVQTTDHAVVPELLSLVDYVDLCIPRGGERLIKAVMQCSQVPVIKHYKGVCHIFVDESADIAMASNILVNAKTQRPGVCNAAETLLLTSAGQERQLPSLANALIERKVHLRCDNKAFATLQATLPHPLFAEYVTHADADDWGKEYLDLIITVGVVENVQVAIDHINHFGSGHSDCIVTQNDANAQQFLRGVDSAVVYWNASTRFTDGGQFGMGAEIGISTDKIGARGPMGPNELTTYKWQCYGNGQTRN